MAPLTSCGRCWHVFGNGSTSGSSTCSISPLCCQMHCMATKRQCTAARRSSIRQHSQPPWQEVDSLNAGKSWTEQRGEEINSQVCEVADVDRTAELLIWIFTSLFGRREAVAGMQGGESQGHKVTEINSTTVSGPTPLLLQRRPHGMDRQQLLSLHIVSIVDSTQR